MRLINLVTLVFLISSSSAATDNEAKENEVVNPIDQTDSEKQVEKRERDVEDEANTRNKTPNKEDHGMESLKAINDKRVGEGDDTKKQVNVHDKNRLDSE